MILQEKKLIELWGVYPPPYGGVSIHLKRLYSQLKKINQFNLKLLNFSGQIEVPEEGIFKVKFKFFPFFKLPFEKKKIIHVHTRQIAAWILIRLLGFKHIKIITLHNQILRFHGGLLQEFLIKFGLNGFDRIILNDVKYKNYLNKKFHIAQEKFVIAGAFLPPLKEEQRELPERILSFRKKKKFLLSATAWQLVLINGIDLYGFDVLIDLITKLKEIGFDVGLIFVLPQRGDQVYFQKMLRKIKENGLENDILIIEQGLPNAFEVWALSDLFLRPTYSDIEGLSVHEALYMGTPVIASDVCSRPDHCFVYHYGNFNQLLTLTKDVLKGKLKFNKKEIYNNNFIKIFNTYKAVLKNK